jgi:hypothetical protein
MEESNKKLHSYCFPDILGKTMANVSLQVQLEASMLSMTFMAFGLVVTITYLVLYMSFPLWYKIFLGINGLAGIIFMWSYLVTTFQQYQNVMEVASFQKQIKKNQLKGGTK